jgi:hypothetical protein
MHDKVTNLKIAKKSLENVVKLKYLVVILTNANFMPGKINSG